MLLKGPVALSWTYCLFMDLLLVQGPAASRTTCLACLSWSFCPTIEESYRRQIHCHLPRYLLLTHLLLERVVPVTFASQPRSSVPAMIFHLEASGYYRSKKKCSKQSRRQDQRSIDQNHQERSRLCCTNPRRNRPKSSSKGRLRLRAVDPKAEGRSSGSTCYVYLSASRVRAHDS